MSGVAKVKEIDAKTEEDFKVEKERILKETLARLEEAVKKKQKEVEIKHRVEISRMKSAARVQLLSARNELVAKVLAETRSKLTMITEKEARYRPFLERLILQGLYMLLDPDVVITCRRQDLHLVHDALAVAVKQFAKVTRIEGNVVVDQEHFLDEKCCGGVVLTTTRGKKKVTNTLESRLELVSRKTLPEIRAGLFGANPHRKFMS
ncbi:hypothetical protein HPB51_010136 [Rhipicephalus microplus]|uniref:Uncharacterized protein n=1 Tax=Rhipicephalus microplus TaxID=6941 RepID=A0A9J6F1L6_RHIMP|nr:hypothetical protein HPB51_010136 [Rhipicephalus microplus]